MNYLLALTERSLGMASPFRPRLPTAFEPPGLSLGRGPEAADTPAGTAGEGAAQPVPFLPQPVSLAHTPVAPASPVSPPAARGQEQTVSPQEGSHVAPAPRALHQPAGPAAEPAPGSLHGVGVWPVPAPRGRIATAPQEGGQAGRRPADAGRAAQPPEVLPRAEPRPAPGRASPAAWLPHAASPVQDRPAGEPAPATAEASPTVHIRIGRIEVRALPQPGPAASPPPARPGPRRQSLEEYLQVGGGRP